MPFICAPQIFSLDPPLHKSILQLESNAKLVKLQVTPYDQTKKQNVCLRIYPWKSSGGFVSLLGSMKSSRILDLTNNL